MTGFDLPEGLKVLTGNAVNEFYSSIGLPNTHEYTIVFVGENCAYGMQGNKPYLYKSVWAIY